MTTESGPWPLEPGSLSVSHAGFSRRLRTAIPFLIACALPGMAATADEAAQSGTGVQESPAARQTDPMFEALSTLHTRQQWLESEIARLQDQLAESASGFIALQQVLREKETLIADLRGQLARLEQANRETEEARRRLTEENAKLAVSATRERATTETDAQAVQERLMALQQLMSDMESEGDEKRSRLAELEQGRDQALSAEVGGLTEMLQGSLSKSTEEVVELKSERAARIAAIEAAEAEVTKLSQENTELVVSLEKAHEGEADLERRLKVLEETHTGAIAAMERLRKDKASLEADKQALSTQTEQLRNELASLQTHLPESGGGAVSAEQLRQEAAEEANAMRELFAQRGQMEDAAWKESRKKLEAALRDRQYLLAQSMSAEGVYRVRRDDNLGKISRKVYGGAGRWPEIFDANRHLLKDPDRLFPGMTLVIP